MKTKFFLSALLITCTVANHALAQSAGDYKSNGTGGGAWNNAATWLIYNDTAYTTASAAPSIINKIIVQAGDTISITSTETIKQLTVDSNALVTIASGKTVTLGGAINVNGALSVNGSLICNVYTITGSGVFSLNAGAMLNIGSAQGISLSGTTGNVQTALRTFSPAANYSYNSAAAQVTGNGLPANITGTITDNNANTSSGLSLSQSIGINSPGSFIVPSLRVLTCKGTAAITGSGSFILNSGATFYIGHAGGISTAPGTGCVQLTGAKIFSADANYTYNGTASQTVGNALPSPLTGKLAITNTAAAGCSLSNNLIVNAPGAVAVTNAFACAVYTLTGSGTFTLNAGATLLTAHPSGISATGSSGSIQTVIFNYNTGANYIYNGSVAQTTGTGLPASVNSLSANNTSAVGLKLTNNVTVNNNVTLSAGILCLNAHNLTIAAGKTIIRQNGSLSLCGGNLIYAGNVNLTYSGTANVSPGVEMPADPTLVNDLTVALSAGKTLLLNNNITVNGFVIMTSGSLALRGKTLTYAPNASLAYNGTAAQIVSDEWPDSACSTSISIRNIYGASGVALNANKTAYTGTLTVRSGGFFNSGNFILSGSGNVVISAGGTFITRHASGVSTLGAIQLTGTRTFAAGSSYTFNGTIVQETGPEMPATVANLTINNMAANPAVILTNAGSGTQTITGTLMLASGIFDLDENSMNLTFHTSNIPISRTAGSLTISSVSSLQFGTAGKTGGAAFVLPDNLFTASSPVLKNLVVNRTNSLTLGNQNLTINGTLILTAGVLNMGNTTLVFQDSDVPVQRVSGSVNAGVESSLQFGAIGHTGGAAFTLPDAFFTTTPVFKNLIINRTNSLTLGSQNSTLTGALSLVNGALFIGSGTLAINGDINITNGMLNGGPASGLAIGGTGAQLKLPAIKNGLNTLIVSRPNTDALPAVMLSADLAIDSVLDLSGGSLALEKWSLTLIDSATILNADAQHYIVTVDSAASGGCLIRNVAAEQVLFPVGTTNYTPVLMHNTTEKSDAFRVRVFDGVLTAGTSGTVFTNSNYSVNKTWVIEKVAAGNADVTLNLQWNMADENAAFERAANFISNYQTTGWDTSDASAAQEVHAGVFRQSWSGPLRASLFSVQREKAALVSWLTFGAAKNGTEVDLRWIVGNARGDRQFDVERSLNNVSFQTIGTVTSTSTESTVKYFFSDRAPVMYQTSYYRLKQTGLDGHFNYSNTVKVAADAIDGSLVYPVPVQDKLNVALHAKLGGWATVYLADVAGKLVKKQPVYLKRGSNVVVVPMQNLPKGVYVVQVVADGTIYNSHKIMKE